MRSVGLEEWRQRIGAHALYVSKHQSKSTLPGYRWTPPKSGGLTLVVFCVIFVSLLLGNLLDCVQKLGSVPDGLTIGTCGEIENKQEAIQVSYGLNNTFITPGTGSYLVLTSRLVRSFLTLVAKGWD